MRLMLIAAAALAMMADPAIAQPSPAGKYLAYAGVYTGQRSRGIYGFRFDSGSGRLTPLGLAVESVNPSFLAVHPSRKFLYAVNETARGSVSAFSINPETGALKLLNSVSSKGSSPCHLSVDRTGKWLFAANYGSGSVAVFPVREDGSLAEASTVDQHSGSSVNRQRQAGPHAHQATLSPDNRFLFSPDLGIDKIVIHRFDAASGALAPNDPPFAGVAPGSGPRHIAFHPDGRFAFAINELTSSVTAFRYDAGRGRLEEIQTIPALPAEYSGPKSGAEIAVHPGGRFVYASNRNHDSIAVFRVEADGALQAAGHASAQGKTPRHFTLDPTGRYLIVANQDSNNVVVFRIDSKTGGLTPTGQTLEVGSPVCMTFVADP